MHIALIDMSGVSQQVLHGSLEPSSPALEEKEFRQAYAHRLYELVCLSGADFFVLALDAKPYWRNNIYDAWYDTHCLFALEEESGKMYFYYNNAVHAAHRTPLGEWKIKRCKKADRPEDLLAGLDTLQINSWAFESHADTLEAFLETSEVPREDWGMAKRAQKTWIPVEQVSKWLVESETPEEEWPEIQECVKRGRPRYKGNRSSQAWNYSMPKNSWYDLRDQIAHEAAAVLGAKIISVPTAEADDVIAISVVMLRERNDTDLITVMSDDTDLLQLQKHPNVQQYAFQKREWVTSVDPIYETRVKILGGDKGDNIAGMALPGKTTCMAKGGAEKELAKKAVEKDFKALYPIAEKGGWWENLKFNVTLVWLGCIPKDLTKAIRQALKAPAVKKKMNWRDVGLTKESENSIRAEAALGGKLVNEDPS